jgi:phosphate transport system substrate-binding protein
MMILKFHGLRTWTCIGFVAALLAGCGGETGPLLDTRDSGIIHISVDESFKPVIDSQVQVYEASNPKAKIIVHYKPEAECLRDFGVDSTRIVIATRGFSPEEAQFMSDSLKVYPSKMVIAYDAIAVIVHPSSPDSLFKMEEIKALLSGRSEKALVPVFDGVTATSTVRFIMDSVLRGAALGPKVVAAKSSEGVIDYVARTPNAVGFLGVSWVGNSEDSTQLSYLDRVGVAQIEHPALPGKYVTPAQYNIYYGRYPMIRQLVYILKEKHRGLGHGFADFLTTERGQLIFKRSYLMPAQMSFSIRGATVSQ